MIGDNAPKPDGWELPTRCCGTWTTGLSCGICGMWITELPERFHLGEN